MSAEAAAEFLPARYNEAPISVPVRNLCLTFSLSLIVLAIAGALGGTRGYEMLIVAMGWPHIILGFLFYFGKVLRGESRALSTFLLLALLTLLLWTVHYNYTITGFIALYFTYHVFRDEVFIYFQTRARHKLKYAVNVAGLIPFILLMFVLTDPRPQHYRQDLRRVDLTDAQLAQSGWTLFSFEPISYSQGRQFYFYLQTPAAANAGAYTTLATTNGAPGKGGIRISDRTWSAASDLVFKPYYADEPKSPPVEVPTAGSTIPVSLKGGHRVGEAFVAERNNLAGIWMPTSAAATGAPANYVFHLTPDASLPLPPLSPLLKTARVALILALIAIALWKAAPYLKQNRAFWIYFLFFLAIFAALQKIIRFGSGTGLEFPIMFQLVVIFHYWSWYVFSFDKLRAAAPVPASAPVGKTYYDRFLASLRSPSRFVVLVVILNLISVAGVLWYSSLHGPAALRYVFDYSYFLYFLVFHVTFSFAPKQGSAKQNARLAEVKVATAV